MENIKKQLIKLFVNRRIKRISKHFIKKINSIEIDTNFLLDSEIIKTHKQKWSRIFREKIHLRWLQLYSGSTKINSQDFVPENIYYSIIEPILNEQNFSLSYSDKNFYDLFYPCGLFPGTILRNIDGFYHNNEYIPLIITNDAQLLDILSGNDMILIKPSLDSGGGKDVELYMFKDENFINKLGGILTFQYLQNYYKQNFIIQKYLHQHSFLEQFNKTSLNTIRVLTYRSPVTNDINILHCILRVGAKNQHIDNFRGGGYAIGVNSKGLLNNFAVNKQGNKLYKVNEINLLDTQFIIPFFDKIQLTAKEIAEKNIHHKLLGLDITIDKINNIRCVEVNNESNEINFYQLNNGTLFGEFTDEVIKYCETHIEKLYKKYGIQLNN
jgi:hypothetical protein